MLSETWIWAVGLVVAVVFFAVVESYAIDYPHNLSRVIATLGSKWPLSIWICGAFAGGLAVGIGPRVSRPLGVPFWRALGTPNTPRGRDRIFEGKCAGGAAPE
jgi:hypothetical protein